MPAFRGVGHVALTVTDLDRSTWFYTEVLGLVAALDLGTGRICVDRATGFSVGLLQQPDNDGGPFTEQRTGLDHLGLAASDLDELQEWEQRFRSMDVLCSPITTTVFGHHLNFRDPDDIALELHAPTAAYLDLIQQLGAPEVTDDEVRDQADRLLGPGLVIRG